MTYKHFYCGENRSVTKRAVTAKPGCNDYFHDDDGSVCHHIKAPTDPRKRANIVKIDPDKLNQARWAACNTRFDGGAVPSMEKVTEAADNAIRVYLGLDEDEWAEANASSNP